MSVAYVVARGGALDNPAPRSARGWRAPTNLRPRRRPLQNLATPDHFVARYRRGKRGAALSSAPPRATAVPDYRRSRPCP